MPYKDGKYVPNDNGKKETWSNVKAGVAQGAREFFKSPGKIRYHLTSQKEKPRIAANQLYQQPNTRLVQLTTSRKPVVALAVEVGIVAKAVAARLMEPQTGAKAPIRLKKWGNSDKAWGP